MRSYFKDKHGVSKLPLGKSRLFWIGLIVKILLSFFFASNYLKNYFAPFSNYFIESNFKDPYEFFMLNGKGTEFPYPPMMLWIFSLPRIILWPLIGGNHEIFTIADSLIYRIPLLIADIAILFVLLRWLKTKTRQVLIWYWLSPVLIYINYFHGQLDVIPIAFMVISLYFLFKNKWILTFLFIAFAIGCKSNMVLVLPFYILYLFRTTHISFLKGIIAIGILILTLFLINLPYLNSKEMIQMVYNNPVQQQVFDLYYQFNGDLKIFFIPSIYFILILYYFSFRFVNRDQLILFLAFTFLVLTLMIAPMQGWYYWIIPLLVYFIVRQGEREQLVFALLSALYFLYFGLIKGSDYFTSFNFYQNENIILFNAYFWNVNDEKVLNIVFTLLQTTLILAGFLVYKKGISSNIQLKFMSQPYMIGIGGDSATGKSTLSNALAGIFDNMNTSIIRGDDMHKWERGNEKWKEFTHLNPRANNLHEDMEQALRLKRGNKVKRSYYDHHTGKFTLPKFIKPNKLIVFEGLHSFYLRNKSNVYDLKVFMEPEENLRIWWKVKRDVDDRGYTPNEVIDQLKRREEDSVRYIKQQANEADIIARFFSVNQVDPRNLLVEPHLALRLTFFNNIHLDSLLDRLSGITTLKIEHNYDSDRQELSITGIISADEIERIAARVLPELDDVGVYNAEWKNDYEGLLQLFIVYTIFYTIGDRS